MGGPLLMLGPQETIQSILKPYETTISRASETLVHSGAASTVHV